MVLVITKFDTEINSKICEVYNYIEKASYLLSVVLEKKN